MHRIAFTALFGIGLLVCNPAHAQAPAASTDSLKFEVASLKPATPKQGDRGGIRPAPGGERYVATNCSLRLMITVAYGIKGDQIVGAPGWVDTDLFDMNGKAERQSTIEELHAMLQNFLAERFKLRIHRDTKEMSVYALKIDKSGPKLQARESQNAGEPWIDLAIQRALQVNMHAKVVTMDYFAFRLSQIMDRPVVNLTQLPGSFDFDLAYTRELPNLREGAQINGEPVDTSGPTIFEAVRKQLGLKLDSEKGPANVIVIDHVEKPSEN